MPYRPKRECAKSGCRVLTSSGAYCAEHANARRDQYEKRRPNAAARGYCSPRWRALREYVLHQEPICRICKDESANELDHIVPVKDGGGMYDLDNLQPLCKPCHSRKTAKEDGRWGGR